MEEPIEGLEPLKVKDLPTLENVNPNNLVEAVSNIMAATSEAAALILNTFEELEFSDMPRLHSRFHLPIFLIGPFHKRFSAATSTLFTHDPTSISWLDEQPPKSVLYVSFGSIAAMEAAHVSIIASGLSESNQKFLWAIRPGSVRGSEWLEALDEQVLKGCSDRSHIVKWAPQQQVLSHPAVGGFWTHGGWNSTLESICEGVPMICSPFFGDQKGNSRYVSDVWKVGIRLENGFVKEDIVSAITRLMVEDEGEEMRRRAVCLKEKTDICLIPGGSSHQALDRLLKFISSLN